MADDCLFCAIVAGTVPADIVYSDDASVAFRDLNPQAPTHVLVIPRVHVPDVVALGANPEAAAAVLAGIRGTVMELGLTGFRTVFNTGPESGQTVFHVHAHVLGGRLLTWPPG